MSVREEIELRGMRLHVLAGILPHEREFPQPIVVDVVVERVPAEPGADVLDYRRLHAIVEAAAGEGPIGYLEALAHRIAEQAMAERGVARVRVRIAKPHVALPGPLDAAVVTVEHSRDA